jgi:hypothetical protein
MSSGDVFNIRDESNIERLVGTINDPLATTGDVLAVQADKSIKAVTPGSVDAPWGQVSTAKFSGSGSPVGVVTPSGEGDLYVDNTTPALYQATGATSADWAVVGGGGSVPVQAQYYGAPVTIANSASGALTWDNLSSGTELLDRTVPSFPTLLAAGTYALSLVTKSSAPLTPGGNAQLLVNIPGGTIQASTLPDIGLAGYFIWIAGAGDTVEVDVVNNDGAASRDFVIFSALLVKLA